MYGTVMIAKLKGGIEDLRQVTKQWEEDFDAPGYITQDVLICDDGETVVACVRFDSKAEYQALADNPAQDEWWQTKMAPLLDDVRWIDGEWETGTR
jgi:antibiotic biosynthesis monooxygenase (ABM) superfamily enzyme